MQKPNFSTAIPGERYAYGEYECVVLSQIESLDATRYEAILACRDENQPQPVLYVALVRKGEQRIMQVFAAGGSEALDYTARWIDLDQFTRDALDVAREVLDLSDERPVRLH